jgi:hypothetical protein
MYGKPVDMCISRGRILMLLFSLPIIRLGIQIITLTTRHDDH